MDSAGNCVQIVEDEFGREIRRTRYDRWGNPAEMIILRATPNTATSLVPNRWVHSATITNRDRSEPQIRREFHYEYFEE